MLVGAEFARGIGTPDTAKASILWIVAFGVLLSMGEMFFSPLGNSFVSKYAPKRVLAVLMGVWTFATFVAGKSYGYLYDFTLKFDMITRIHCYTCYLIPLQLHYYLSLIRS
ncbi:hypothetical protein Q5M85_03350 [Paraclostridium bifermentans]|nr:hypothetical protein [Paraclostridium bifermentans]